MCVDVDVHILHFILLPTALHQLGVSEAVRGQDPEASSLSKGP